MLFLILQTISITTTMMIIWEALELGSNLNNVQSGLIVFTPIVIYIFICYKGTDISFGPESGRQTILYSRIHSNCTSLIKAQVSSNWMQLNSSLYSIPL